MASISVITKNQPPKARKRVAVPILSKDQGDKAVNIAPAIQCDKDPIGCTSVREAGDEDTNTVSPMQANPSATLSSKSKGKPNNETIKITRKRRAPAGELDVACKATRTKKEKDPNEPKRPPTAFFLFMEEFRQTYKNSNPNAKGGSAPITKAGSEKWRSMSDEAKENYFIKSASMKEDYQKALKIYSFASKDSIESTITDNAEGKCDAADDSCEETAASNDHASETEN